VLGALRMEANQGVVLGDLSAEDSQTASAVFNDEDLKQASVGLERAFARATPQQDVALRLSQLRSNDLVGFLRSSRVTAARLFYRDGRLNVIFGVIDLDAQREAAIKGEAVPKTAGPTDANSALHFETEIGYRNRPRRLDWNPMLPAGARLYSDIRNDWIELDPGAVVAAARASGPIQERRAGPGVGSVSETPVGTDPETAQAAAVERRLRELRSFLDQGLISEELYREKVRELVDRFVDSPAR